MDSETLIEKLKSVVGEGCHVRIVYNAIYVHLLDSIVDKAFPNITGMFYDVLRSTIAAQHNNKIAEYTRECLAALIRVGFLSISDSDIVNIQPPNQ